MPGAWGRGGVRGCACLGGARAGGGGGILGGGAAEGGVCGGGAGGAAGRAPRARALSGSPWTRTRLALHYPGTH